ncbi:MAG: uncharacterized protein JWP91_3582 [Fibrobacteres bacterium]|nr:uncharacterized protein [Fibrobacterota bacterium]
MLALLISLCACSKKESGHPADAALPATKDSSGFHARPLTEIPPVVPPLQRSEWLQNHFAWYVAPQGKPPESWSALEKNIHPEACGACHQQQFQDWKQSLHHKAMGPSVLGQLLDMELDAPVLSITCQRCHAPLAEQIPYLEKGIKNPVFEPGFREQGLVCAACHVRGHQRFGPPSRNPSAEGGPHGGFTMKTEYESPAFCASCHDFTPGGGMHGKLVQETAEEWRRTPFAAEGKTCQSCHMPDRRHLWKGIHDSAMVSSAVSIQAQFNPPARPGDSLRASVTLTNVGAGHRFPTYTEPQVKIILEQVDAEGKALEGTRVEGIIARRVTEEMDRELFDTRLLPGETFSLEYSRPKPAAAAALSARVEVWPDEAYRLYFKKMLETDSLRPEMPAVLGRMEEALKQDTQSRYLLWRRTFRM